MARSLTVNHREEPGTSSLLNAFLVLSFAWLFVGMLVSGAQAETAPSPDQGAAQGADLVEIYPQ